MPKKLLKYGILAAVIALLAYKSVYIKKLSEVRAAAGTEKFDAVAFAGKLWKEQMPAPIEKAVDLAGLFGSLQTDAAKTFEIAGHSTGITNTASFMVHSSGQVTAVNEDEIEVSVPAGDSLLRVKIATEYIYGNTIRDASGLVDIRDFTHTADLNNISEELNKIVRKTILPSFKAAVKKGDRVEFTGALELNREHLKLAEPEIIPVKLKIIQ